MLSLKKLLSNHFIFLRKVVISSMTIFLLLFGVMPVKVNKVYADENVKINPFIWLMSYFGVNIYTDAVQINEAFDTAIRLAYNTYLASLQPQQQVSIDAIIDSIEWTPSQPNVLRVTGTIFNALKGFANWVSAKSLDNEPIILENFEVIENGYYTLQKNIPSLVYYNSYALSTRDVRFVIIHLSNQYRLYGISDGNYSIGWNSNEPPLTADQNSSSIGSGYYSTYYGWSTSYSNPNNIPIYEGDATKTWSGNALYFTYGDGSVSGEATLNDIFALPEQAVLDDLIGAADPSQDVEIDLTDSDLPYTTAATLEDILSAINNLVDSYVQDNSYPETIGKVISQGIAIDDELIDVTYPEALTWEVPDLISIPAVYPIIYPDCPDLSSCLISGVQEVSNTMNGIINAHPDTGNYVTAALYMGLVLLILGSTVL